jgi:hypothetical protein
MILKKTKSLLVEGLVLVKAAHLYHFLDSMIPTRKMLVQLLKHLWESASLIRKKLTLLVSAVLVRKTLKNLPDPK